jgi:ferrous iron transport protein B
MRLTELEPGRKAVIARLEGGRAFVSRLASLGFTPGAPLILVRGSGAGPTVVLVRGARVALGRDESRRVIVRPAENEPPASPEAVRAPSAETRPPLVALAGQPNVGKSSLFNLLTRMSQHVGNWTGKTVACAEGTFPCAEGEIAVVDLPGTYSLTAASEEERLARDFIIKDRPDVIVAVANAAQLERSLYLVAELVLLPVPIILVLNMMDVAQQEGIRVEPKVLAAALGIPVVPMVASKGMGLDELKNTIMDVIERKAFVHPQRPPILPAHQAVLDELVLLIRDFVPSAYPSDWVALKLLEGDEEMTRIMKAALPGEAWARAHAILYKHEDAILDVAGARYEWIARIIRAAFFESKLTRAGISSRLDKVLTHPWYGTAVLLGILGLVFWLTFEVGNPLQHLLARGVDRLAALLRTGGASAGVPRGLVEFGAGGVLGGIGMVLTFLPILALFFLILGFLEDTGYLARAAFLTDRWMHMIGLHGKSFMPILMSFGCNVPGVLGTRIIESRRARLLTILLIPLVPCAARLAVISVLASAFFGRSAFAITWGLVAGNILLLALVGLALHHFLFKNEHVSFIMELPLYHVPNARTIGRYVRENILSFLRKAGTVILAASLAIWALSFFPHGRLETSWLAAFGRSIEPIGRWMGLPWPVLVAVLTSFVAKENTIATLGVLYGGLAALTASLPAPGAVALLVFQMLFVPCVGTLAAIRQETRSWRWPALSIGLTLALSLAFGILAYRIGGLF